MSDFDPQSALQVFIDSKTRLKYFPFIYIPISYIENLCKAVIDIFLNEESVVALSPPLTVCGDTHGQFTGSSIFISW